jgi:hypothetical protein
VGAALRLDPEDRLVVVGPGLVDHLHEVHGGRLHARVALGERPARGALDGRRVPAVVGSVRGREVAIDLLEVAPELPRGRAPAPLDADVAEHGQQAGQDDHDDDDDLERVHGGGPYRR